MCLLVLVASFAAANAVSSLSGNFQNCNIQCGNDQAPPLPTSSSSSSFSGSMFRRGKSGPKGDRGPKGDVGPAGASCQCSRVPELEEKVAGLETLLNESKTNEEKNEVRIAAMEEKLDNLTRAYELEQQKKKFISGKS